MNGKGERLRELRLLKGMTQKDFSALLGIPQPHLSAIERGKKGPGSAVATASFVFKVDPQFFEEPTSPYQSGSLNFRTKKISARTADAATITFTQLERSVRKQLRDYPFQDVATTELGDRSEALGPNAIEDLATQTRLTLGMEATGPAFNVTRAVERAGIPVVQLHNPDVDLSDIDGISSPSRDDRGVIAVTAQMSGDRARFTRAHELGHLVLHTSLRPGLEKVREDEAHLFAGAFLMPRSDARQELSPSLTLEGYAQVKARYAVSIAALIRRAYTLGIIGHDRYRSLNIQLSSRGWRKREPVEIPIERTQLLPFEQLAPARPKAVSEDVVPSQSASVTDLASRRERT